jgi:hypothetical protein
MFLLENIFSFALKEILLLVKAEKGRKSKALGLFLSFPSFPSLLEAPGRRRA